MIENEKVEKYLDLTRVLKKKVEHDGNSDTNCSGSTRSGTQ